MHHGSATFVGLERDFSPAVATRWSDTSPATPPRDSIVRVTIPDLIGRQHQAIPLFADLGGAILLRADGTFLELEWDQPSEQHPREVDSPSWRTALVAGIERYPWLDVLLPDRPPDAAVCDVCGGTGRITYPAASEGYFFCAACDALGWRR